MQFPRALVLLLALCGTSPAQSQTLQRLPDGEMTTLAGITAYLINPTTRYDHGALGDTIEAGGFAIETKGKRLTFVLGEDAVFEDLRVRLADLDGDGTPEAIVVKSYLTRGAAIAVYRITADGITPLAESPAIGARNRWLNPIGVADFTGTGEKMIAAVITPHLEGSLRLYRLNGSVLQEVARQDGLTNHINGTSNLDLARIITDRTGTPSIVLPTLNRRAIVVLSFKGGAPRILNQIPLRERMQSLDSATNEQAKIGLESGQRKTVPLMKN